MKKKKGIFETRNRISPSTSKHRSSTNIFNLNVNAYQNNIYGANIREIDGSSSKQMKTFNGTRASMINVTNKNRYGKHFELME